MTLTHHDLAALGLSGLDRLTGLADLLDGRYALASLGTTAGLRTLLDAAYAAKADVAGPDIIAPPSSLISAPGSTTWPLANNCLVQRFHVPYRKAYRWFNTYVGVSSGNVQAGVMSIRRSGTTVFGTRLMDSGVIACPTGSTAARIDCGATTLAPGEYGLFFWCDNVTASFLIGSATGFAAPRTTLAQTVAGGVPTTEMTLVPTTRWQAGTTLESDS